MENHTNSKEQVERRNGKGHDQEPYVIAIWFLVQLRLDADNDTTTYTISRETE